MVTYKTVELKALIKEFKDLSPEFYLSEDSKIGEKRKKIIKDFIARVKEIGGYEKAVTDVSRKNPDYLIIGRTKTGRYTVIETFQVSCGYFRTNTIGGPLYSIPNKKDMEKVSKLKSRIKEAKTELSKIEQDLLID